MKGERIIVRDYRVTIPKEIRKEFGIKDGSVLEVWVEDEKIILNLIKA